MTTSPSSPTLPCLPEELLASLTENLGDHELLRATPQGRIIGHLIDYTTPDTYAALVPASNVEMAEAFPLLYNAIAAALYAAGRVPVFPNSLSLPVISLSGPIKTKLPCTYLDLATGNLVLTPPTTGPVVQFHVLPRGKFDAVFS